MDFYNKALHGKTARGRVARKLEPCINETDYSEINTIFSKGSQSMRDIEKVIGYIERQYQTSFENA
jgi:hypothetical protein